MAPPGKYARRREPDSATAKKRGEERQAGNTSFPVVGVGASAGGLEAFRQLLERLPVDTGMAFVLVQHLDPTHESILAELLSRSHPDAGERGAGRDGRRARSRLRHPAQHEHGD